MDANNDESICYKCLRKNSALEKENKELKLMMQQLKSWLKDIPCAWLADNQTTKISKTPQANPSSHQLQPLRDKKERTNKEDQTKNANSAGSTDLPDRDLEVEEEGQAIGGDGGGTNSHEDDRKSPEDFDTAMKEEEEDIDDYHENHLTGNGDPLSLEHASKKKKKKKKPKEFKCDRCGKVLTRKLSLIHHMAIHDGGFVKCDVCEKSFGSPSSLKQHMESAHSPEIFFCHPCQIPFRAKRFLQNHLKNSKKHIKNTRGGSQIEDFLGAEPETGNNNVFLVKQEDDNEDYLMTS